MRLTKQNLFDKDQTAKEMYRIIDTYNGDLDKVFIERNGYKVPLSSLPVEQFFGIVKDLPYRKDLHNIEIVQRPKHSLSMGVIMGADCKKKSILMGSYFKNNGIPFRLIGSSRFRNKRIHHVFPQAKMNGRWVNMDATYKHYKPGEVKRITKAVIL